MSSDPMPGGEFALRLLAAFRDLIDALHAELAVRGHPDVRPGHGFALQALQALGPVPATASELAARLGVSKQAASKTLDVLAARGYVDRRADPGDARRRPVTVTDRGRDLLALSGEILDRLRDERAREVGPAGFATLEDALRRLTRTTAAPVDAIGWLSS